MPHFFASQKEGYVLHTSWPKRACLGITMDQSGEAISTRVPTGGNWSLDNGWTNVF
jgi:hypothetical protein